MVPTFILIIYWYGLGFGRLVVHFGHLNSLIRWLTAKLSACRFVVKARYKGELPILYLQISLNAGLRLFFLISSSAGYP